MRYTGLIILLISFLGNANCFSQKTIEERLCEELLNSKILLDEQEALINMSLNAQIYQAGSYNSAQIQDQSDDYSGNSLVIIQEGTDNHAALNANGYELNGGISQKGDFNNTELNIKGSNTDALVTQNGKSNFVQANLTGTNSSFLISQKDTHNSLKLNDISINNIPAIIIEMNGRMSLELDNGMIKSMLINK